MDNLLRRPVATIPEMVEYLNGKAESLKIARDDCSKRWKKMVEDAKKLSI